MGLLLGSCQDPALFCTQLGRQEVGNSRRNFLRERVARPWNSCSFFWEMRSALLLLQEKARLNPSSGLRWVFKIFQWGIPVLKTFQCTFQGTSFQGKSLTGPRSSFSLFVGCFWTEFSIIRGFPPPNLLLPKEWGDVGSPPALPEALAGSGAE